MSDERRTVNLTVSWPTAQTKGLAGRVIKAEGLGLPGDRGRIVSATAVEDATPEQEGPDPRGVVYQGGLSLVTMVLEEVEPDAT